MLNQLETPNGIFPLEVWRYEKSLTRPPEPASPTPGEETGLSVPQP
jgi:hypothetical protein